MRPYALDQDEIEGKRTAGHQAFEGGKTVVEPVNRKPSVELPSALSKFRCGFYRRDSVSMARKSRRIVPRSRADIENATRSRREQMDDVPVNLVKIETCRKE